jgi:hypothetical protein
MGGRTDAAQPQSTWPAQMMPSLLSSSSNTVSTTSSCAGEQGSGGLSWSAFLCAVRQGSTHAVLRFSECFFSGNIEVSPEKVSVSLSSSPNISPPRYQHVTVRMMFSNLSC